MIRAQQAPTVSPYPSPDRNCLHPMLPAFFSSTTASSATVPGGGTTMAAGQDAGGFGAMLEAARTKVGAGRQDATSKSMSAKGAADAGEKADKPDDAVPTDLAATPALPTGFALQMPPVPQQTTSTEQGTAAAKKAPSLSLDVPVPDAVQAADAPASDGKIATTGQTAVDATASQSDIAPRSATTVDPTISKATPTEGQKASDAVSPPTRPAQPADAEIPASQQAQASTSAQTPAQAATTATLVLPAVFKLAQKIVGLSLASPTEVPETPTVASEPTAPAPRPAPVGGILMPVAAAAIAQPASNASATAAKLTGNDNPDGTTPASTPSPDAANPSAAKAAIAPTPSHASGLPASSQPTQTSAPKLADTASSPERIDAPVPAPTTALPLAPASTSATGVNPTLSTLSQATLDTTAQLAAQIAHKLSGRSTRFEMGLTPEGLGRVDVSLEIDTDGQLTARLAFDNPLAATELRGRADELRRQLENAGFTLANDALSFAERDPSQGNPSNGQSSGFDRRQDRAFAAAARIRTETDPAWIAPALATQPRTLQGVDMKV